MAKIVRALLSVTDKTGIVELAKGLADHGVEILSTGGTAKKIAEAGVPVKEVSDHTGFPEMLDGRVKTLHPMIHGGLLGRRDLPDHQKQMADHQIKPIDLVCVNLYRFEQTVADPDVAIEDAVENIDIGGPSMIRSAAKNHKDVTIVTDPADYSTVLSEMSQSDGAVSEETNRKLAAKAFSVTAAYDTAISAYFAEKYLDDRRITLSYSHGRSLRYGENAHQSATFYVDEKITEPCLSNAIQHHGKEISFNNLVDAEAALEAAKDLVGQPGVAIIKHTNPCGYATGDNLSEAMEAAWQGDPISAFGSVIAVTQRVDFEAAQRLKGRFVEILLAPGFEPDALEYLKKKSKDIRLMEVPSLDNISNPSKTVYRPILGGLLAQDRDLLLYDKWDTVSKTPIPDSKKALAEFTWKATKHTKSNAIVLGWEYKPGHCMVIGMGAGQPNRIDSLRKLAVTKAHENWEGLKAMKDAPLEVPDRFESLMAESVLGSDAFFPFADTVEAAAAQGIKAIVQPGGSIRDNEVIETADRLGIQLVFTGTRHFRH